MKEEELDALVGKSVDDLFAALGLGVLSEDAIDRVVPAKGELVKAGRRRFEAMLSTLRTIICREEVLALARSTSSERELIVVLVDAITGAITGVPIPALTVGGLIAKIGVNKLCRE